MTQVAQKKRAASLPAQGLRQKPRREVFRINFARSAATASFLHYYGRIALMVFILLNLLVFAVLVPTGFYASHRQARLKAFIENAMSSGQTLEAHEPRMRELRAKASANLGTINRLASIQAEKFTASERLAALSLTLPARTWIAEIRSDRERRSLWIKASYLRESERPYYNPVADWTEALRADAGFSAGLKDLSLKHSSESTLEYAEIYHFEMAAEWETGKTGGKTS